MVGNSNKQFQVKTSAIALSYSYEKSITLLIKVWKMQLSKWHIKLSLSYKNNESLFLHAHQNLYALIAQVC